MSNVARVPSKQLGFSGASVPSTTIDDIDCDISVFVGAVVYMDGGVAKNAIANDSNKSKPMGICVAKASSVKCSILLSGVTDELYSGLDDKKFLFLSDAVAGNFTAVPVTTAGNYLVNIGQPFTDKRVKVNIMPSYIRS